MREIYLLDLKEVNAMWKGVCGLIFRAFVICFMCIYAANFISAFYHETNRQLDEFNKSVNYIYDEIGEF